MSEPAEKDFLKYRGGGVPRFIRFAWTLFFAFGLYYLIAYALPDLKLWLGGGS